MVESPAVNAVKVKEPTPPIGVLAAITAGFDAVTARLDLILPPLVLEVMLWLGPHLSVQALWQDALEALPTPPGTESTVAQNLEALRTALSGYAATFNLFSTLSAAPSWNSAVLSLLSMLQFDPEWLQREQNSVLGFSPLGLPSLLAGRSPTMHPGGEALLWQVNDPFTYILLWVAFILLSLFLGAWYLGGIAQQVREARSDVRQRLTQVWGDWARLTALSVLALVVTLVLGLPLAVVALAAGALLPGLFWLMASLGWTLWMWGLFYTGFTVQGIILQRRNIFGAIWDSVRLVQANLPGSLSLFLLVSIISLGLGVIWNYPPDDSWYLLIGLAGHALISTALVAATFVFYQDRYRWMVEMQQALLARRAAQRLP
jgi:hypothetical protein